MGIHLLGSLEVVGDDGAPVRLAGGKLRSLLARPAIDVGRVVLREPGRA